MGQPRVSVKSSVTHIKEQTSQPRKNRGHSGSLIKATVAVCKQTGYFSDFPEVADTDRPACRAAAKFTRDTRENLEPAAFKQLSVLQVR